MGRDIDALDDPQRGLVGMVAHVRKRLVARLTAILQLAQREVALPFLRDEGGVQRVDRLADRAARVVALAELDAGYSTDEASGRARETREYRARFASLRALQHALSPFRLQIHVSGLGGVQSVDNVSIVEERNVIMLHDSSKRVVA